MSIHDPLTDPQPGDIVGIGYRFGRPIKIKVMKRTPDDVEYRYEDSRRAKDVPLRYWRIWARGGEVLSVARTEEKR